MKLLTKQSNIVTLELEKAFRKLSSVFRLADIMPSHKAVRKAARQGSLRGRFQQLSSDNVSSDASVNLT